MKFDTKLYVKARKYIVIACVAAMAFLAVGFTGMTYIFTVKPFQDEITTLLKEGSSPRNDSSTRKLIRGRAANRLLLTLAAMLSLGTILSCVFALRILKPIKEAHEKQATFTANAHHQIKTPIAIMRAEIENARLKKQSSSTTKLLESLLDELSEVEDTTKIMLEHTQLSTKTASMTVKDFRDYATSIAVKIGIEVRFTEPLSPLPLHPQDVQQLIQICFENTIAHSNVRKPQCTVSVTQHNDRFIMTFADNGKGSSVNKELLLQRGFSTKKYSFHSGLGLAIAKDIVKEYGGYVTLKSSPRGFMVRITI